MYHSIPMPFADAAIAAAESRTAEGREKRVTLRIADLDCNACARRAEHALRQITGVLSVTVGRLQGAARVRYDGKRTSAEEIASALRQAGYRIEESAPPAVTPRRRPALRVACVLLALLNLLLLGFFAEDIDAPAVGLTRLGLALMVLVPSGAALLTQIRERRGLPLREVLIFGASVACFGVGLLEIGLAQDSVLASLDLTLADLQAARPLGFESAALLASTSLLIEGAVSFLGRVARAHLDARESARGALVRRLDARGVETRVPRAALSVGDRVRLLEGEPAPADLHLDRAAHVTSRAARGLCATAPKVTGEIMAEGAVLLTGEVTGQIVKINGEAQAMDAAVQQTLTRLGGRPAAGQAFSFLAVAERAVIVAGASCAAFALALHLVVEGSPGSILGLLSVAAVLVGFSTAGCALAPQLARAIAVLRARESGVVVNDVDAFERLAEATPAPTGGALYALPSIPSFRADGAETSAPLAVGAGHPGRAVAILALARRLRRVHFQNAAIAALYNAFLLPAAAIGFLSPREAAALLLLETAVVLGNTARLLRVKVEVKAKAVVTAAPTVAPVKAFAPRRPLALGFGTAAPIVAACVAPRFAHRSAFGP